MNQRYTQVEFSADSAEDILIEETIWAANLYVKLLLQLILLVNDFLNRVWLRRRILLTLW